MNVTEPVSSSGNISDMIAANEALVLAALRALQQADDAIRARCEIERLGGVDALTQLPGRAQILEALTHAVAQARRGSTRLAVLFLDLDDFKRINDGHGHGTGDEVLRELAVRMKQVLREADFVGRYGGDEFVVLLTDVANPADAAPIADKLIAALDEPLRVGNHVLRVTPSIGIALFPEDATACDELLARADAAMYCAKARGAGRYAFSHEIRSAPPPRSESQGRAARTHALSNQESTLLRDANLGMRLALLGVLRPHAARQQARQLEKALQRAVVRCLSDEAPDHPRRPSLGQYTCPPQVRPREIAAWILCEHLVSRGQGQHLLQVSRHFGKISSRFAPKRRRTLSLALLGYAATLAHEGPVHGAEAGRDGVRFPVQPHSIVAG